MQYSWKHKNIIYDPWTNVTWNNTSIFFHPTQHISQNIFKYIPNVLLSIIARKIHKGNEKPNLSPDGSTIKSQVNYQHPYLYPSRRQQSTNNNWHRHTVHWNQCRQPAKSTQNTTAIDKLHSLYTTTTNIHHYIFIIYTPTYLISSSIFINNPFLNGHISTASSITHSISNEINWHNPFDHKCQDASAFSKHALVHYSIFL